MKCPVDGAELVMSERSGIEIDYCPKCRGVWLDRGELDKIVERAAGGEATAPRRAEAEREDYGRKAAYDRPYSDDDDRRYDKRHRRKSFLGDLFDFD
jgi:Zn-finger nucleic acid-binding protein